MTEQELKDVNRKIFVNAQDIVELKQNLRKLKERIKKLKKKK